MDKDKKLVIQTIKNNDEVAMVLSKWRKLLTKSAKKFTEIREEGNKLFIRRDHDAQVHEKIWKFYSQSIAYAPNESEELALAFSNRSALMLHLKKIAESITDIDRALAITKSDSLRKKLLFRKKKCLNALEGDKEKVPLKKANTEKNNFLNETIAIKINKSDSEDEFKNPEAPFEKGSIKNCNLSNQDDKVKIQKILSEKESANPFKVVAIKHNEKYGRHLVAIRDIKPGEIIMVEKPYIKCLNLNTSHAFCGHCLKLSWTSIPCHQCNWCMFCSEECSEEAWKKYHDIECLVIPYINFLDGILHIQIALRLTIFAVREAGSISQLQKQLKEFEACKNSVQYGFSDGKFYNNQFQTYYSLSSNVSTLALEYHIFTAVLTVIMLAKSTLFFGKNKVFDTKIDLLCNEDVIFICVLLFKFLKISDMNSHSIIDGSSKCRFSKTDDKCVQDHCCNRGVSLATLSNLMNHSSYPNIRKCFTNDMHLIVYAIQPIKKNSQLFDCYTMPYYAKPYLERRFLLQNGFNFTCDCIACKQHWISVLLEQQQLDNICTKEVFEIEKKFFNEYKDLIFPQNDSSTNYNLSILEYVSKQVEKIIPHVVQPSHITVLLINMLNNIFDNLYGDKLLVTNKCFDS